MSLLPEDAAANHISKVLSAAAESGLPVWREIRADQCKRFILNLVPLELALTVNHGIVHDSWWLAKKAHKNWGPWYIGQELLARKEAAWQREKQRERADAQNNQLAVKVAEKRDVDAGYKEQKEWRKKLTVEETEAIVRKWIKRTGAPRVPTGPALAWEWKEMRENNNE